MRVLLLLSTSHFSGAENVACQIYNMLKTKEDYEVVYCSPNGDIQQKLIENNIDYLPLDKFGLKEIKKAIAAFKPDIIHAHDMRACLLAGMAAKKIPIVGHIHNNWLDSRKISLRSLMFFVIARKLKRILWVSRSSFEGYKFHNSVREKSEVLYNVIDIRSVREKAKKRSADRGYDVVYLGRLTYQKNLERLILIVNDLARQVPDIKVAIIGTGELYEDVKQMISDYKLENNVEMLGYQKEPYGIVQNSKLLILTSRWEGTPMVVLEALCLGTPVVSTPVDGVLDLINSKENGYLSDDNDELRREIIKMIEEDNYLQFLSKNAIKTAEDFNDLEKYKKRLIHVYENSLRK